MSALGAAERFQKRWKKNHLVCGRSCYGKTKQEQCACLRFTLFTPPSNWHVVHEHSPAWVEEERVWTPMFPWHPTPNEEQAGMVDDGVGSGIVVHAGVPCVNGLVRAETSAWHAAVA